MKFKELQKLEQFGQMEEFIKSQTNKDIVFFHHKV